MGLWPAIARHNEIIYLTKQFVSLNQEETHIIRTIPITDKWIGQIKWRGFQEDNDWTDSIKAKID